MAFVSAELIENTWQRVGDFNGNEITKLQKCHRKAQNPLATFVYDILHEFREDAAGVAMYVYHVVLEAFQKAEPRPKRVSKRELESISRGPKPNAAFDLDHALDSSREPHALRYVYEALTEDEGDVVLSAHELESFLAVLQGVIECLHRACKRNDGGA